MSLLLQLNSDLPDRFSGHERRLYVLGCRRKPCRRKEGSVRAFRAIRTSKVEDSKAPIKSKAKTAGNTSEPPGLGDALFGSKSTPTSQANPFSSTSTPSASSNPFSTGDSFGGQNSIATNIASANNLPETFAHKARISGHEDQPSQSSPSTASEPWINDTNPYPSYHLDADKEYLYPESHSEAIPSNARLDNDGESSSAADDKAAFESAMDKTFQKFADRLSQNPEQVLRYEFGGEPLLYSKTDAVGKHLAPASEGKVQPVASNSGAGVGLKVPRCSSCGAGRVFELQLTPHTITELEAEDTSIDGMEWGTIIVGVCGEDCQEKGKGQGEVGYVEEWVGVQWEEMTDYKKR
jgi:pre-rRNA-processing protein TSR4